MREEKGFCYSRVPISFSIKRQPSPILNITIDAAPIIPDQKKEAPPIIETAGRATLAIVFKYFQIVDLLMNFFGKVNVQIGQDLQDKVNFLNNAELPEIGFLSDWSLSRDGGQKEVESYEERSQNRDIQIDQAKATRILSTDQKSEKTTQNIFQI